MTNWEQIAAEAAWVSAILALMAFVAAAIAVAVTLSTNSAQQRTLELPTARSAATTPVADGVTTRAAGLGEPTGVLPDSVDPGALLVAE